jgi:hypothetical protein
MNQLVTIAIIGVAIVSVIAGIVIFQFVQQQQAISNLDTAIKNEDLKAEYKEIDNKAMYEKLTKCGEVYEDENMTIVNPVYEKCSNDIEHKYGLDNPKYDSIRTDAILEQSDAVIEATNELNKK